MKTKIKGSYLIIGGIVFFALGKILYHLFPMSIVTQSISAIAELSWLVFIGIGIIMLIRERKERKKKEKELI